MTYRVWRVLGALFSVALSLSIVVSAQGRSSAFVTPIPTPTFISSLMSGTAAYGSLPAGVAAEPLTLIGTGVGAYQGTCMFLGAVVPGDTTCDVAGATDSLWHLVTRGTWLGSPDSYVQYSGPSGTISHGTYSPGDTSVFVNLFALGTAGLDTVVQVTMLTAAGGTCSISVRQQHYSGTPPNVTGALTLPATGTSAANAIATALNGLSGIGTPVSTTNGCSGVNLAGLTQVYLSQAPGSHDLAQWNTGLLPAATHTATFTETCQAPGGTTFTRSGSVSYTPVAGQSSPDVHLPNCWDITPGSVRTQVGVTVTRGGSTVETATQPTVDPALGTKYPDCVTTKCLLSPYYVPTSTPCFTSGVSGAAPDCVDYWSSQTKNPDQWQCRWGSYRVAMSYCTAEYPPPYFETGTRVQSNPTTAPSPSSTAGAFPTTGPNPSNGTGPGLSGSPDSSSCWGSSWSWNPVSWVETPVKCVFEWAFIPTISPTGISAPSLTAWKNLIPTSVPGGTCETKSIGLELPSVNEPGHDSGTQSVDVPLPDTCAGTAHTLALLSYGVSAAFCTMGAVMFVIHRVGDET